MPIARSPRYTGIHDRRGGILEITAELIAAGASERGGLSRQQMALLGVEWPPKSGWRQSIIGRPISDDDAQEFIRLAGRHLERKAEKKARPVNWCGSLEPIDIYLYVLARAFSTSA